MGIVNYIYEPNDPVWVITGGDCPAAIRDGVVLHVRINVTAEGSPVLSQSEILYAVLLTDDNGPITYLEADVFPSLAAANAEYEIRLTP